MNFSTSPQINGVSNGLYGKDTCTLLLNCTSLKEGSHKYYDTIHLTCVNFMTAPKRQCVKWVVLKRYMYCIDSIGVHPPLVMPLKFQWRRIEREGPFLLVLLVYIWKPSISDNTTFRTCSTIQGKAGLQSA